MYFKFFFYPEPSTTSHAPPWQMLSLKFQTTSDAEKSPQLWRENGANGPSVKRVFLKRNKINSLKFKDCGNWISHCKQ